MEYITVGSLGKGEYVEKKSRFLGEIHPVLTEAEAAAVVAAARKKYYDARHHCYGRTEPPTVSSDRLVFPCSSSKMRSPSIFRTILSAVC